MAQTTTSAPQQQVAMPAVDLRQFLWATGIGEGTRLATDLAVVQRAAGANMSVDVGTGTALIQDDHGTGGGFYSYTLAAAANVTVAGSDPTNPRIDRVVIRVRDQALGDAANDAAPVVVAGTATAGATLTNLNGAAAVPASSLLLANILIPAAATSVTTANIDNTVRQRAGGPGLELAYVTATTDFGPTAVTTTGNGDALHDLGTITTENVKYYYELSGLISHATAAQSVLFRLHEGTAASPSTLVREVAVGIPSTGIPTAFFVRVPFTPAAGTRAYSVRMRGADANTYTLNNSLNPLVSRIVKA